MKNSPIQKYILKNERNFGIAATVAESWPEVREKVISVFLDRLELRMVKKLKGWKFEREKSSTLDRYTNFYFWKSAWEDQYYLCLHFGDSGHEMSFGVFRAEDHIGKRKFSTDLLSSVRIIYPSARPRTYWEAEIEMHSPARDWQKPEALWLMHKDNTFLEEVADQLLRLARNSTPILDRLSRRK